MTFSALIDWADDRLNPIVVKELRQAVKSRLVVSILMLFLGIQLFLLGINLVRREAQGELASNWGAGMDVFFFQQIVLLWTIAIIIPAYAAVRMGAERSDQNVDLMFSSTLTPSSIIWGKFFATLLLGMLVFSTCAPFMTFTYLLRGIDIPTILATLAIDLLVMVFNLMVALFLASLPGARVLKFVYSFIGFLMLVVITYIMNGLTYLLIYGESFAGGNNFLDWLSDYWPIALSFVAGVFALMGLFYSYAIAIISPPTSNRMFPVRLFLFGLVVTTLGGAMYSTFKITPDLQLLPIVLFLFIVMPILCVQIWISMCEREQLGLRVRRAIPRNPLAQVVAFFFYTGSASGVLFCVLLIAASLGICAVWLNNTPTAYTQMEEAGWLILFLHVLMALYAFCYGQTAVLIRRYLLSNQIRPGFTWVIAALLVGLGMTLPPSVAYFLFSDQIRYSNDVGWWFVPNPFMSYLEYFSNGFRPGYRHEEFDIMCLWFLLVWSALVALLSVPWVYAQVQAFQPHRTKPDSNEELAAMILLEPDATSSVGVEG